MFKRFKKLFEKSTTKKSRQEFFRILELEKKRQALEKEYGSDLPEDIATTQKEMLRNNMITLAKVVDSEGGFLNPMKNILQFEYFNIQGTMPQVHVYSFKDNEAHSDPFSHNVFFETKDVKETATVCDRIDTGAFAGIINDLLKLEEKFMSLKSSRIKTSVKNKLASIAEKKIIDKVNEFVKYFKGNEQLVKEYVFSGLTGEDDHWHNYNEFRQRLNFMGLLYYKLVKGKLSQDEWDKGPKNLPIADADDFDIGVKRLVFIHSEKNLLIEKILKRMDIKTTDFIVHEPEENMGYGGNILDY